MISLVAGGDIIGLRSQFQRSDQGHGVPWGITTDVRSGLQPPANCGALGQAKQAAATLLI
jgi:hypothetical protein